MRKPFILKKWILKIALLGTGAIVFFILIHVFMVRIGIYGEVPNEATLRNIKNNIATNIISVDNKLLGRYYYQNRTNTRYEDIPNDLINALVATEDVRYYQHSGIDFRSTMRVLVKTIILSNKSAGGGSTISQQLAKNIFPRKDFGFMSMPVAKTKEMIIARRLEKLYTKEEILELYLNTVSFGENAYGVETGALIFFNKAPSELKIEESAILIGLLKANTSYNPKRHKQASFDRRNTVMSQMVKYGYLTKEQYDSLKQIPLSLQYQKITHNEGPAPYFREHLRPMVESILSEIEKPDGSHYNIYTEGLTIYTTINGQMQIFAEAAVQKQMKLLQKKFDAHWRGLEPWKKDESLLLFNLKQSKCYQSYKASGMTHNESIAKMKVPRMSQIFTFEGIKDTLISPYDSVVHHFKTLQTGLLAMNGHNGDMLAWVGGINYKFFKYDHVKSKRQAGSTFKPIVYAAAIENGVTPCAFYKNDSMVYTEYDNWCPVNSNGKYGGYYSVKGALANSVNTVSVKLLLETGFDKTINLAHQMGISSNLPEVPSLALGTGSVSLYEMVQAYSCILNKGRPITPRIIRRIEDARGNVLYENKMKEPGDSVMSQQTAQTVLAMMQGVVDRGTAHHLRSRFGFTNELAGKTGTTQNHTDGWFMAVTPNIIVGSWVGGDNPAVRFRSLGLGAGGATALPVVGDFFNSLYTDPLYKYMYNASFKIPENIYTELECEDFDENEIELIKDILNIDKSSIGNFIRNIFERNKNKKRNRNSN